MFLSKLAGVAGRVDSSILVSARFRWTEAIEVAYIALSSCHLVLLEWRLKRLQSPLPCIKQHVLRLDKSVLCVVDSWWLL